MLVLYKVLERDEYNRPASFEMLHVELINKVGNYLCEYYKFNDITFTYYSFQEMMSECLHLAKKDSYELDHYIDFGALWYDIRFVNADDGSFNRYPFKVLKERKDK